MIWFPNFVGKYIDIKQTEFRNLGTQEERDVDYPVFWNLIAMCLEVVLLTSFMLLRSTMYVCTFKDTTQAKVRIYDRKLLELFQEEVDANCGILT